MRAEADQLVDPVQQQARPVREPEQNQCAERHESQADADENDHGDSLAGMSVPLHDYGAAGPVRGVRRAERDQAVEARCTHSAPRWPIDGLRLVPRVRLALL